MFHSFIHFSELWWVRPQIFCLCCANCSGLKTAAGCGHPLNPAAATDCLPHSDVKCSKPPHWACSDKTASTSWDRSLAVICEWKNRKAHTPIQAHRKIFPQDPNQKCLGCRIIKLFRHHTLGLVWLHRLVEYKPAPPLERLKASNYFYVKLQISEDHLQHLAVRGFISFLTSGSLGLLFHMVHESNITTWMQQSCLAMPPILPSEQSWHCSKNWTEKHHYETSARPLTG